MSGCCTKLIWRVCAASCCSASSMLPSWHMQASLAHCTCCSHRLTGRGACFVTGMCVRGRVSVRHAAIPHAVVCQSISLPKLYCCSYILRSAAHCVLTELHLCRLLCLIASQPPVSCLLTPNDGLRQCCDGVVLPPMYRACLQGLPMLRQLSTYLCSCGGIGDLVSTSLHFHHQACVGQQYQLQAQCNHLPITWCTPCDMSRCQA